MPETKTLILSGVRILRFVSELRREFLITAVNIVKMARQNWIKGSLVARQREAKHFPQSSVNTPVAAANASNDPVTERSGITFPRIDSRDLHWELRNAEENI